MSVAPTLALLALAAYTNEPYAHYPELACYGRNELKSSTASPSSPTYEGCRTLCDAASTCLSFEYVWSSTTCTLSTSCLPAHAKESVGFSCVPTPLYMCPRLLPARSLPRFFSLCSHAPGPPADARSLPCLPSTNQRTRACGPPDCSTRAEIAISRSSSGGRLNVKKSLAKSQGKVYSTDYTWFEKGHTDYFGVEN